MNKIVLSLVVLLCALNANAGFILHGVELGVGKFHRMDNKAHPYGEHNAWANYILGDGLNPKDGFIQENKDGSVSVFFTSLEELFQLSTKAAQIKAQTIDIFNVHGHGLPGAMWYPIDQKARDGIFCGQWRSNAFGSDNVNFDTYYTTISKSEIMSIRRMSQNAKAGGMPCISNSDSWTKVAERNPGFKSVLSDDVQINFLSCVVGLGAAGENFSATVAKLLLKSAKGKVMTNINFGLGDWSLPEGMSFWDYISDSQLDDFNRRYPVDHKDRDIMIKGTVRETVSSAAQSENKLFANVSFLELNKPFSGFLPLPFSGTEMATTLVDDKAELGFVRIPHTNEIVFVK